MPRAHNDLAGAGSYQGSGDAYVAKYNSAGVRQWLVQLGSSLLDFGQNVVADAACCSST